MKEEREGVNGKEKVGWEGEKRGGREEEGGEEVKYNMEGVVFIATILCPAAYPGCIFTTSFSSKPHESKAIYQCALLSTCTPRSWLNVPDFMGSSCFVSAFKHAQVELLTPMDDRCYHPPSIHTPRKGMGGSVVTYATLKSSQQTVDQMCHN